MTGSVEITLLDGGSFIADSVKLHAGVPERQFRLYNWAFYVYHRESGQRLLWDMGVSNSKADYSTFISDFFYDVVKMTGPRQSLTEQMSEELGISASDINAVIFSHAHFDHCRPHSPEFPKAMAYFGPGTRIACTPGHLKDPSSQWDGRFFDPENKTEPWEELRGPWVKFAAFDKAMDYFGDGSFWIIQAPGHMKGNLCAVARLRTGEYIILGSDCCHSKELYDGKYDFAVFDLPGGGQGCLQEDVPAAKDTIRRIRATELLLGAHLALAHDATWVVEEKDEVLLSLLPRALRHQAKHRIQHGEVLMKVGVIGPAGFGGSYVCVELINRGHHVIGISRRPESFGQHANYTPCPADLNALGIDELAAKFSGLDVLINEYGPHSAGHEALQYMPFLEVTRKIVLATREAKVGYFIMVGGCGSLYMPNRNHESVLENKDWWVAYRRAIADSEAHTSYMEERLGPMGTSLRKYRNARAAEREGKGTPETKNYIKEYEEETRTNDTALKFITGCRTSFMFFDGNTSFKWTFVSPSALYRPGKRTGSYEVRFDRLALKGDEENPNDLEGRLHGISAADLAIAIVDEAENPQKIGRHWTAFSDLSDDSPTLSYLTSSNITT